MHGTFVHVHYGFIHEALMPFYDASRLFIFRFTFSVLPCSFVVGFISTPLITCVARFGFTVLLRRLVRFRVTHR